MAKRTRAKEFVLLDSSVIMWAIDHSPDPKVSPDELAKRRARRAASRQVITKAHSNQIVLVVSAMALIEVANPDPTKGKSDQEALIRGFLDNSYIDMHAIDHTIAETARHLRRDHAVDLWGEDMAHVATAVRFDVPYLLTTDGLGCDKSKAKRLAKKPVLAYDKRIPLRSGKGLLRIMSPEDYIDDRSAREGRYQDGLF